MEKNSLIQEELKFRELEDHAVNDEVDGIIYEFIYSVEYKSEEAILKKFSFGYVISIIVITLFYHQMGTGFTGIDIGSSLSILGVFKNAIDGLILNTLSVASVLILSFSLKDIEVLNILKNKQIYIISFFMWIFICMFGVFSWTAAFLWLFGAFIGLNIGFNFGVTYLQAREEEDRKQED